ncbi:MAG TPA: glycosyltransferase, partial [Flavobacteriaceae bacterium]|nr:glycosyltransferase [Flavobacteriaceae bacterium]
ARNYFQLTGDKKIVLILGGSLGARNINRLVERNLNLFKENNVEILWQTGKLYYNQYKKHREPGKIQVYEYLDRMDLAYAAADIIVSRAGAGSVSELCIVGKPVIFIPSPNVAEDHQTKNARAISEKKAALLIAENDLETDFKPVFLNLLKSEEEQKILSTNISKLAKPHATKEIVDEIEKLIQII